MGKFLYSVREFLSQTRQSAGCQNYVFILLNFCDNFEIYLTYEYDILVKMLDSEVFK